MFSWELYKLICSNCFKEHADGCFIKCLLLFFNLVCMISKSLFYIIIKMHLQPKVGTRKNVCSCSQSKETILTSARTDRNFITCSTEMLKNSLKYCLKFLTSYTSEDEPYNVQCLQNGLVHAKDLPANTVRFLTCVSPICDHQTIQD